jgi:hypothetical protein
MKYDMDQLKFSVGKLVGNFLEIWLNIFYLLIDMDIFLLLIFNGGLLFGKFNTWWIDFHGKLINANQSNRLI